MAILLAAPLLIAFAVMVALIVSSEPPTPERAEPPRRRPGRQIVFEPA
jgi:hypothetical protein